ncbi:MAG: hypothetical protein EA401_13405 [Planctomycetota bacterium]|nr:MAG: hypothetical protein EA401_13405 [Planctomycetota bacterium]
MSTIPSITAAEFDARVLVESELRPVLVDIWAPWCGPCQTLAPILEALAQEQGTALAVVKINSDEEPELAQLLGVSSIPDVRIFRNGAQVDRFVGVEGLEQIRARVARHRSSPADAAAQRAAEALSAGDVDAAGQHALSALVEDALHPLALATLARACLAKGDRSAARQAHERLLATPGGADHPQAQALNIALQRAEERAALVDAPAGSSEARYALALDHAAAGDYEAACEELLAIIAKDKQWQDGAARARLLEIFDELGKGHPTAEAARRRLGMLLF